MTVWNTVVDPSSGVILTCSVQLPTNQFNQRNAPKNKNTPQSSQKKNSIQSKNSPPQNRIKARKKPIPVEGPADEDVVAAVRPREPLWKHRRHGQNDAKVEALRKSQTTHKSRFHVLQVENPKLGGEGGREKGEEERKGKEKNLFVFFYILSFFFNIKDYVVRMT